MARTRRSTPRRTRSRPNTPDGSAKAPDTAAPRRSARKRKGDVAPASASKARRGRRSNPSTEASDNDEQDKDQEKPSNRRNRRGAQSDEPSDEEGTEKTKNRDAKRSSSGKAATTEISSDEAMEDGDDDTTTCIKEEGADETEGVPTFQDKALGEDRGESDHAQETAKEPQHLHVAHTEKSSTKQDDFGGCEEKPSKEPGQENSNEVANDKSRKETESQTRPDGTKDKNEGQAKDFKAQDCIQDQIATSEGEGDLAVLGGELSAFEQRHESVDQGKERSFSSSHDNEFASALPTDVANADSAVVSRVSVSFVKSGDASSAMDVAAILKAEGLAGLLGLANQAIIEPKATDAIQQQATHLSDKDMKNGRGNLHQDAVDVGGARNNKSISLIAQEPEMHEQQAAINVDASPEMSRIISTTSVNVEEVRTVVGAGDSLVQSSELLSVPSGHDYKTQATPVPSESSTERHALGSTTPDKIEPHTQSPPLDTDNVEHVSDTANQWHADKETSCAQETSADDQNDTAQGKIADGTQSAQLHPSYLPCSDAVVVAPEEYPTGDRGDHRPSEPNSNGLENPAMVQILLNGETTTEAKFEGCKPDPTEVEAPVTTTSEARARQCLDVGYAEEHISSMDIVHRHGHESISEEKRPEPSLTRQLKRPEITVDELKLRIYAAGVRAHRSQGSERLFGNYWNALCRAFGTSLQDTNRERRSRILHGTRETISKFLTTKKLKRLHNELILGLLCRCGENTALADEIIDSIPSRWKGRVNLLTQEAGKVPKIGLACNRESFEASLEADYKAQSAVWMSVAVAESYSTLPSDAKLSLTLVNDTPVDDSSPSLPGALVVDPFVRVSAQKDGLKVTENAIWLVMVGMREYMKSILKNTIACVQSIEHESLLPSSQNLVKSTGPVGKGKFPPFVDEDAAVPVKHSTGRKRKSISVLDLVQYLSTSSVTRGRSTNTRIAFEESYVSAYDPVLLKSQSAFESIRKYFVSGIDTQTTKKHRSEKDPSFVPPSTIEVDAQGISPATKELDSVEGSSEHARAPVPTSLRRSPSSGVRGMGRGAKNLAALKARAAAAAATARQDVLRPESAETTEEKQPDNVTETRVPHAMQSASQRPPAEAPLPRAMQPTSQSQPAETPKAVQASKVDPADGPSEVQVPKQIPPVAASRRGGRGFGVKNLAMMRARSVSGGIANAQDSLTDVKESAASAATSSSTGESNPIQQESNVDDSNESLHPSAVTPLQVPHEALPLLSTGDKAGSNDRKVETSVSDQPVAVSSVVTETKAKEDEQPKREMGDESAETSGSDQPVAESSEVTETKAKEDEQPKREKGDESAGTSVSDQPVAESSMVTETKAKEDEPPKQGMDSDHEQEDSQVHPGALHSDEEPQG